MRYLLPITTILLLISPPSRLAAQDVSTADEEQPPEPTLDETMDFLVGFLPVHSWMSRADEPDQDEDEDSRITYVSYDGCTLVLIGNKRGGAWHRGWRYTVDLSEIDPLTLRRDDEAVYIEASGGRASIPRESIVIDVDEGVMKGDKISGKANVYRIELHAEPGAAVRIERAFKHAVKLCGGRVSPF